MHCRLLTQYDTIMVQFLAGLRKIKLHPGTALGAKNLFWLKFLFNLHIFIQTLFFVYFNWASFFLALLFFVFGVFFFCFVLFCFVFCFLLFCFVFFCFVLFCFVLFCFFFFSFIHLCLTSFFLALCILPKFRLFHSFYKLKTFLSLPFHILSFPKLALCSISCCFL